MWSTIFLSSRLMEILRNFSRFQFDKIQQNCSYVRYIKIVRMLDISNNFKDTKKDQITVWKSSLF